MSFVLDDIFETFCHRFDQICAHFLCYVSTPDVFDGFCEVGDPACIVTFDLIFIVRHRFSIGLRSGLLQQVYQEHQFHYR